MPMGGSNGPSRRVIFPPKQLRLKFKHAGVFGIVGGYSALRANQYEQALRRHIDLPATLTVQGTFRRRMLVTLFVDPSTGLMVMTDEGDRFVSAWRLNQDQLSSVLDRGTL